MKYEIPCFDCNGHGVHGDAPAWPCQTCDCDGVLLIDRRGRVFGGDELLFTISLGRLHGFYSANEPQHVIMPMLKRSIRAWETVEMAAWAAATTCMLMMPMSMLVMAAGTITSIVVALIAASKKLGKRMVMSQWGLVKAT